MCIIKAWVLGGSKLKVNLMSLRDEDTDRTCSRIETKSESGRGMGGEWMRLRVGVELKVLDVSQSVKGRQPPHPLHSVSLGVCSIKRLGVPSSSTATSAPRPPLKCLVSDYVRLNADLLNQ